MQAVILAAGEGTRMRPLTATRPKPMLPVDDRPLLAHVLDACVDHVDEIVLVVGYHADVIREYVGDRYHGTPVEYVEQAEQLGTAHAIGAASEAIEERFLVCNGDAFVDPTLISELASAGGMALAVQHVDDPRNYGVIDRDGDRLTGIVEKPADPPSSLANLGIYAFEPSVLEYVDAVTLSERGEYEVTDAIEAMVADGVHVQVVENDGRWLDVGRPWELLAANEDALDSLEERVDGTVHESAVLEGNVVVEPGATVRAGSVVEGPVRIREGATVGPNAYVRGRTVVGTDARVGNAVEVKNTLLMEGAAVPHQSYVGDSILGRDVNLGAGTIVANLRHDDEPVSTWVKGERVSTGRRKYGIVAGDGAKTGINTSLNAGVTLEAGATTRPGAVVLRNESGGEE
jgi:bifunctional UDP-N-acetylglucosamine pyrophosphorylase/glucosamine-1-phosphate N-acetyltransferase